MTQEYLEAEQRLADNVGLLGVCQYVDEQRSCRSNRPISLRLRLQLSCHILNHRQISIFGVIAVPEVLVQVEVPTEPDGIRSNVVRFVSCDSGHKEKQSRVRKPSRGFGIKTRFARTTVVTVGAIIVERFQHQLDKQR